MLDIPERSLRAEANVVEKLRPNGKKKKRKEKKREKVPATAEEEKKKREKVASVGRWH